MLTNPLYVTERGRLAIIECDRKDSNQPKIYVPLNICPFTLGKRFKARRDTLNLTRHMFTPHAVCLSLLSVPGI